MAEKTDGVKTEAKLSKAEYAQKIVKYLHKENPTFTKDGMEKPSIGVHTTFATDKRGNNFGTLWRGYFGNCSKEQLGAEIEALIAAKSVNGRRAVGGYMLWVGKAPAEKSVIDPSKVKASVADVLNA